MKTVVERMGLDAQLRFPSRGGNLGPADLALRFKPPSGVGLSIEAQAGGRGIPVLRCAEGGIRRDCSAGDSRDDRGEGDRFDHDAAAGWVEGFPAAADFGEGFAPIQLGLGFTLTGVGGLLGVNRSVRVDAPGAASRMGWARSVSSGSDPQCGCVVSDMRNVFPAVKDRTVLGPMAVIGWGTPTILTLELALLLENAGTGAVDRAGAVVGHTAGGTSGAGAGADGCDRGDRLQSGRGVAGRDALRFADSGVHADGDMALRARWGADPTFVLAIGRIQSAVSGAGGFRELDRLALSLSDGDDLRLRCECYLALTSNTVQLAPDWIAAGGGFTVDGYLGVDALFHFAPFGFVVDIGAGVALRYHGRLLMGIYLEGTLSGPTPWQVRGKATFKVLFFKVSVVSSIDSGRTGPRRRRKRWMCWRSWWGR